MKIKQNELEVRKRKIKIKEWEKLKKEKDLKSMFSQRGKERKRDSER